MLGALQNGTRVEADVAERGQAFNCPGCRQAVILKRGKIVTAHFAHKPPVSCILALGETPFHLLAKKVLQQSFSERGFAAYVEWEVLSVVGDRRADVLVQGLHPRYPVAFEIQHQSIDQSMIEHRTQAYMAANIPVIWLGLLKPEVLREATPTPAGFLVPRYSVRPWEKWVHAFGFKTIWFLDPHARELWQGTMKEHRIEVPVSTWYEADGEEQSAGGYTRSSKRWRELHLSGPVPLSEIRVRVAYRKPWSVPAMSLPGGISAQIEYP